MKKFVIVLGMAMLLLCACGSSASEDEDGGSASLSFTLKKDGSVEMKRVEDFGADYSADGLKSLIDASITAYQKLTGSAQISLKSCEQDSSGQILIEMTFNSGAAYAGWNNYFLDYLYASELGMELDASGVDTDGFFAGTISEAYASGYSLDVTLTSVSGGASVSKSDLLGMGDSHIVILACEDEVTAVTCYGEILYAGANVTVTGKKSAQISASDGYEMIVFE